MLQPAQRFAVGVGLHVEGAAAADEVVAEGEVGVAGAGVADDVGAARDDELSQPKRPHNPSRVTPRSGG